MAHLIIVVISFIFLVILILSWETAPWILENYGSPILVLSAIGFTFLYAFAGTLMDTEIDKKYDFLTGLLIAAVGIGIWLFVFFYLRMNRIPEKLPEELV